MSHDLLISLRITNQKKQIVVGFGQFLGKFERIMFCFSRKLANWECLMRWLNHIVYHDSQGLTEKFKEKDKNYSGSATFAYEEFMLTVLPFLIA